MNAFFSWIRRGWHPRPLAMTIAIVSVALAVVFVLALGSATPVAAQGPTSCFEAMVNPQPQEVIFDSSTYTVTVNAGTSVCVDSAFNLMIGFFGQTPFAVNGEGASKLPAPEVDYLYGQGPISGTLTYDLTASEEVDLVLTDVNGTNGSVLVWLGSLKTATTSATPTMVAKAQNMVVAGPGTYTKNWSSGNLAKWGPFTRVGGQTLDLVVRVTNGGPFTMTETTTYGDIVSLSCGASCWEATVPADLTWTSKELEGRYWEDKLVGPADARVLVPAPVQPAPAPPASTSAPASAGGKMQVWKSAAGNFFADGKCAGGAVVFDPAHHVLAGTCGGGRGKIAGAPTPAPMRFTNLPLLVKP